MEVTDFAQPHGRSPSGTAGKTVRIASQREIGAYEVHHSKHKMAF